QLTNLPSNSSIFHSGFVVNSTISTFSLPLMNSGLPLPNSAPYAYNPSMLTFASPVNGVIDNLQVKQVVDNPAGFVNANVTVTLYKNNAPTNLSCALVTNIAGATCNNLNGANAVTVNMGDTFYYV